MTVNGSAFDPTKPQFMTSHINLVNGVLTVDGTDGIDDVRISLITGNMVRAVGTFDGQNEVKTFDQSNVFSIEATLLGEDDVFRNATAIASTIFGGSGNDDIMGGSGSDTIFGNDGKDKLNGSAGNDIINGNAGADEIIGGAGLDQLDGGENNDNINGGDDDDLIIGGLGNDILQGKDGDDLILGGGGQDTLSGGLGDDAISGQAGMDIVNGNKGDDLIKTGAGNDIARGDQGNDLISGGNENDTIFGGSGADVIDGGDGNDNLNGGGGDDSLGGGSGNDSLNGKGGFNSLNGQSGDDVLRGRFGFDAMNGGGEAGDKTITKYFIDNNGDDVDFDFSSGEFTLREAITIADGDDIILFNPLLSGGDQTITLTNGELNIDVDLNIRGRSSDQLTIDANNNSRIFNIAAGANVQIRDIDLVNGSADFGGGIRVFGNLDFSLGTISGSTATTDGGGIQVVAGGTALVDRSTIRNNTATSDDGGGIHNEGTLHVSNSTINNNTADSVGGGIAQLVSGATMTIINSTVSNNTSDFQAGVNVFGGMYEVINSTIAFNMSNLVGFGGAGIGVLNGTTGHMDNTIVVGNLASGGANDVSERVDASNWFNNLIGRVDESDDLTDGFNGHIIGATAAETLNASLADNGGQTQTHALFLASRAVNVGRNDKAVDRNGNALTRDQTEFVRINSGTVDIGSYEF